jgi:uncharacterized membrane protein (UPF0127 family)
MATMMLPSLLQFASMDHQLMELYLPNGRMLCVDVVASETRMRQGLKGCISIPENFGMLFVHSEPGAYRYTMEDVRIPLDIIWMDQDKRVVGIAFAMPGLNFYQNAKPARFVLEIGGGEAQRLGLRIGDTLQW